MSKPHVRLKPLQECAPGTRFYFPQSLNKGHVLSHYRGGMTFFYPGHKEVSPRKLGYVNMALSSLKVWAVVS